MNVIVLAAKGAVSGNVYVIGIFNSSQEVDIWLSKYKCDALEYSQHTSYIVKD